MKSSHLWDTISACFQNRLTLFHRNNDNEGRSSSFRIKTRILHTILILSLLTPGFMGKGTPASATQNSGVAQGSSPIESVYPDPIVPYQRPDISRTTPRMGVRPEREVNQQTGAWAQETPTNQPGIPLLFVENMGQYDSRSRFQVLNARGTIRLAQDAIWMTLIAPSSTITQEQSGGYIPFATPEANPGGIEENEQVVNGVDLRFQFAGSNPDAQVEGINPSSTNVSYFYGSDPAQWRPDVQVWEGVKYVDLYPGVDLEITGNEGQWAWSLIVRDSSQCQKYLEDKNAGINLLVEGQDQLVLENGFLRISTSLGEVTLPIPQVVMDETALAFLAASPSKSSNNEISILVPKSEETSPATPDQNSTFVQPYIQGSSSINGANDLIYSTYLGGTSWDLGYAIVVDDSGSTYITGYTISSDFPTSPGAFQTTLHGGYDVFITKLNPSGSNIIYSTYLGGSNKDMGMDIAIDGYGNAYITGPTWSTDFPVTSGSPNGNADAFVTRLNQTGTSLVYSVYLGGSAGEEGLGIDVSQSGETYVTGQTFSYYFPVTSGAYDTTYNGGWDGFLTKYDNGGNIIYSTYIGGSGFDCETGGDVFECSVAVDGLGYAYVAGMTNSTDFPTTPGAYDRTYNGGQDGFILKLNPQGSQLVYSTYFGGSGDDCTYGCRIDIDTAGGVYVTGGTNSTDFPVTQGAYQGARDAYIFALTPDGGSLKFSYLLGGSNSDMGRDVSIYAVDEGYLVGDTNSTNFPVTSNAYQSTLHGTSDFFIIKFSALGVIYSTYLGGSDDEIGYGITSDDYGASYVTGFSTSTDYPITVGAYQTQTDGCSVVITKLGLGGYTTVEDISTDSSCGSKSGVGDQRECPLVQKTQGSSGDPINTRTGGFDYSVSDLSIPTSAGPLIFQRIYSSQVTGMFTSTLGYGWTHNHDTRLIFANDPLGEPGVVLFKAHSANLYKYTDNGDGTYTPYPGVQGSLQKHLGSPVTYTLTMPQQEVYVFDADGRLLTWDDSQGHTWTYTYDLSNRMEKVTDETGLSFFELGYDPQGRITSVVDQTGREVSYGYDGSGDLTTFTNVLNQNISYTYDASHRLRLVTDPRGITVVHTEYDALGRAYQQYNPDGSLSLSIAYNQYGTTVITDALGYTSTHVYDARKTLVGVLAGPGSVAGKGFEYDNNFRATRITDENDNVTSFSWSADGANLVLVADATGAQTDMTYDGLNNLTSVIDPRDFLTTYVYSGTLLISSTDPYTNTTIYTYTTVADAPQPSGLIKEIRDPLGHVTHFTYNEFGQRTSIIDALDRTTAYAYDYLGRLQKVTLPSGQINWSCYDAAGRMVRTVTNATGNGGTPQTDPCDADNYQPSSTPGYDRITTVVYDISGNVIANIDPNGIINRTYYDNNNRPTVTIQNLAGQPIENPTPPTYDPAYPNQNLRTDTVFDQAGNTIAAIDTLGHITRTYYDAWGRAHFVVQNLIGQPIETYNPPVYNPSSPDQNIRTEYVYDAAGNLIASLDTLGRITRTYYDALNQPRYVVQNLVGQDIEVNTPPAYDANYPDHNIRTETVYDANGNAIATIDTLGRIQRTYYDALNRAETTAENLVIQGIEIPTPPSYNPDYPDQNVRTDYVYDEAGNLIATVDPAGAIARTYYDALNRAVTSVRNLTGQAIENPNPPTFNPVDPDANVRSDTIYDAVGNVIAAIDTLGHVTRTYYDTLDRPYLVLQNLYPADYNNPTPPAYNPDYPDRNVHHETVYDQDGKTIAVIDNAGSITRTYYDELSRPVVVVRNLIGQPITNPIPPEYNPAYPDQNVRTETVYGPGGNVSKTIDPNGKAEYSCYDEVNRTIKTIENPTVVDPCTSYTPSGESDHDIITQSTYDGLGNRLTGRDPNNKETVYQYDSLNRLTSERDPLLHTTSFTYDGLSNRIKVTDARSVVTKYEYDAVNRVKAIVENSHPGETPTNEVNVRTQYIYDGIGNRRAIRDALNHLTSFDYDGLNRLLSESDPLSHITTYGYDGEGNRVSILDANGNTTTFQYDDLNRLKMIDYPSPDTDVQFTYEAAGNRSDMTDGMGTTQWAYDGLYRPQAITDPFSGIVNYGYDAVGNRKSITYPDTKSVAYIYDDAGRLQTVNSWGSLATNYSYDKAGRMQSVTLPNTVVSTYGYDDDGQLTSLAHMKGTQTLSTFQYQYDEIGNRTRVAETVFQPTLQNTGLKSPTAQAPNTADGDKNGFEVNPAYALADGGGFAVDNKSGTNNSTNCDDAGKDKHNFYNFNITFPVNTTIQGIEARLDAKVDSTSYSPQMCVEFSWNGGTSWTAAKNTPTLSTSETTYLLGGSSDTWGRTWSMTDFSNANLRVRVINVASSKNKNFSLDWIAVKVYYKTTPTVDYTYDPLYRLTSADYNDGRYYHYTYDAVGNRLTEQTQAGNTTYSYDIANRLISVNSVTYTWDNNGNLLNDGVYTYSYDHANRLKTSSGQGSNYSFGYNGNGDRLRQTVNSVTTNYTLDLNAGLTQVLSDGSITYLYGNGRILQDRGTSKEYFLTDALGSVRQLTDASGAVILGKSYQPYGKVLDSSGSGSSSYGFTGEWTDGTGLIDLRARYYAPGVGRFISRDTWGGNYNRPVTLNKYNYALSNPILYTDPSGHNPIVVALLPSLIGASAGITTGIIAGGIFGACTYEWALAGKCGCDMQLQALSLTRWEWIGAHALGAGLIGGVGGAIAFAAPIGLIAVGVTGIVVSGVDIYHTYEIIKNETGITACTITRLIFDVVGMIFSSIGIAKGVQQWRVSGSFLQWANPTTPYPPTGSRTAPRVPTSWQDAEGLVKQALGIDKNREIFRFPGMTKGGKPDFVGPNYIVEVKWYNSGTVSLSDQLRNYIIISQNLGKPLWLYVRQATNVSQPLIDVLQGTRGGVARFFP